MCKIKLVATDMDGTLLNNQKEIPKDFHDWVRKHDNVVTVIASGRQYYSVKDLMIPIHDRLTYIADNGAVITHNDEIIYTDGISTEDANRCLDVVEKMPYAKALVCCVNSAYIENPTEHQWEICSTYNLKIKKTDNVRKEIENDTVVKIAIYYQEADAEKHIGEYAGLPEKTKYVLSGVSWIDISSNTVSKGTALKVIQEKFGVKKEECIAFGDYLNDVDLLEACGESYCMKNSHPDVFLHAKYIAPSNDEDGVMQILKSGKYEF